MGKSKKVGKIRFYPMLAAWLEFARSDEIRETGLQPGFATRHPDSGVAGRAIHSAALRDARPGNPASTPYDNYRLAMFQAPRSGPLAA